MYYKILYCLLALCNSLMLLAQNYNGPESVVYDTMNNRYLISNIHSGQILQRNLSGTLSPFVSGLTSPKGMVIKGDTLFVTDVTRIVGQDNAGNYYVSGWGANAVFKFDNSFSLPPVIVASSFNGPADIFYDPYNQVLAVPELNGNNVRFIPLVVTNVSNTALNDIDWNVFPNPATEILYIKSTENFTNVMLFNLLGQSIMNATTNNDKAAAISIAHIMPGIYFACIFTENGITAVKKVQINH